MNSEQGYRHYIYSLAILTASGYVGILQQRWWTSGNTETIFPWGVNVNAECLKMLPTGQTDEIRVTHTAYRQLQQHAAFLCYFQFDGQGTLQYSQWAAVSAQRPGTQLPTEQFRLVLHVNVRRITTFWCLDFGQLRERKADNFSV